MLRVIQSNPKAAKGYYVSKAEYLAGGKQEMAGRWGGKGAAMLGLSGEVGRRAADALCDNRDPRTGETLTARQRKDRTPGYDFNFHACKSASILYGLTGDGAILDAFRSAVDDTMRDIEAEIKTRVRTRGRSEDRTAGIAIWAEYTHFTARPVAGIIDPHLHSHCFVYNAAFDPEEARWKAGQFRDLKADAPRFQQTFHRRFAWRLAELGYPVERKGEGWEVAGIDRATIERFSRRTQQVKAFAAKRGITDPKELDGLGARTRGRKHSDASMAELREEWDSRLTDKERAGLAVATIRRCGTVATESRHHGGMTRGEFDACTSRDAIRRVDAGALPPGLAERQGSNLHLLHRQRRMHQDAKTPEPFHPAPPPPRSYGR